MDGATIGVIWLFFVCFVFILDALKYEIRQLWKWFLSKWNWITGYIYDIGADLEGVEEYKDNDNEF